jgi:hypothetical protein
MHGHEKCTFYNNDTVLCLDCDGIVEIEYMCVHGIRKLEKQDGCTCKKPEKKSGKHRKK